MSSWKNRIIGYDPSYPVDQITANPLNARIHPANQQEVLDESLDRLGWIAPALINQRTGFLLDGHARVGRAMARGEQEMPVVFVDLDEEEEARALSTYDAIGNLAIYDRHSLEELIGTLNGVDPATERMLADILADAVESNPFEVKDKDEPEPEPVEEPDLPPEACPCCGRI
jgi:ParB-like chromosome segregation protein Spo0J